MTKSRKIKITWEYDQVDHSVSKLARLGLRKTNHQGNWAFEDRIYAEFNRRWDSRNPSVQNSIERRVVRETVMPGWTGTSTFPFYFVEVRYDKEDGTAKHRNRRRVYNGAGHWDDVAKRRLEHAERRTIKVRPDRNSWPFAEEIVMDYDDVCELMVDLETAVWQEFPELTKLHEDLPVFDPIRRDLALLEDIALIRIAESVHRKRDEKMKRNKQRMAALEERRQTNRAEKKCKARKAAAKKQAKLTSATLAPKPTPRKT